MFSDMFSISIQNGEIQLGIAQTRELDCRCNLQKLMIAAIAYMNCKLRIHI